jgi:hypothetical protein
MQQFKVLFYISQHGNYCHFCVAALLKDKSKHDHIRHINRIIGGCVLDYFIARYGFMQGILKNAQDY